MAVQSQTPVQEVDYDVLKQKLMEIGQKVDL